MRPLWSTAIQRLSSHNRFRFSRFFDAARRSQILGRGGVNRKNQGQRTSQGRAPAQDDSPSTKSSAKLDESPNGKSLAHDDEGPPPVLRRVKYRRVIWRRVVLERHVLVDYPLGPRSPAVKKLNASLKRGLNYPTNDTYRKKLWIEYQRVLNLHPDVFQFMPDDAWTVLWATQSRKSPTNDNRVVHMKLLADHQAKLGSSNLYRAYLEDLFYSGEMEVAASEWNKMYESSSNPVFKQQEYLEFGVKVCAKTGRLDRAQLILDSMDDDTKTLMPYKSIFEGLRQFRPDDIDAAWNWYNEVHDIFGDEMTDSDYEFFWTSFSSPDSLQYSQNILEDMLRSRFFEANFRKDERQFFRQFTLQAKAAKTTEDVERMFRPLLNTLPAYFSKGIFYNVWLKRLLDLHDVKAALEVVELAYESNCVPAPRIMDTILLSWVESRQNLQLAEEIALRMVAQRLEMLKPRMVAHQALHLSPTQRTQRISWVKSEISKTRPVPPATSGTFSVLLILQLERLQKDGLTEKVIAEFETIIEKLSQCALPPNPKGLSIILQYHLRRQNLRAVQACFMEFIEKGPQYLMPNEASIAILWNACYLSIARRGSELMKEETTVKLRGSNVMKHTLSSFKSAWRGRTNTMPEMSWGSRITNMLMKCFCAVHDFGAALMALRILAHRFGIFPTSKTIEIIAGNLASVAYRTRSPQQRRLTAHNNTYQGDAAQLVQVMSTMFNMRVQSEGVSGQELDSTRRAHIMLDTLTKFLRLTMLREQSPKEVEENINQIRKYWHAEDCPTGDQTAVEIYVELYMNDALGDAEPGQGDEPQVSESKLEQESKSQDEYPFAGDEINELHTQNPLTEDWGEEYNPWNTDPSAEATPEPPAQSDRPKEWDWRNF